MHSKNNILIVFILMILITSSASAGINNADLTNDDLLLLKAGHVNTTDTGEDQYGFLSVSSFSEDAFDYYIIQFSGPVREQWKQDIGLTGAELYTYVPNNAFIARMNASSLTQVQSLDFVKWVGEYRPSYKYDLEIVTNSDTGPGFASVGTEETQTYHISLFSADEYVKVIESLELSGVEVLGGSGKIIRVQASGDQIDAISSITGISWIEEYVRPTFDNDEAAEIITTDVIHNTYGLNGSGQIVAVADTGIDIGVDNESMHADLRGRIIAIFDIAEDGSAADVASGHGTHVSGSVLGNGSLSGGQYAGMAPEAQLVMQALADGSDNLYLPSGGLEELFQQAYNEGARIHTNSWGSDTYGLYTDYSEAVDQFMWDHPDMLILFSAGNEGIDSDRDGVIDSDSIGSPATAKNCLTVGASENNRSSLTSTYGIAWPSDYPVSPIYVDRIADDITGIAAFSSRGPTDDGRIKPDVVAPGTFIISTRSSVASGTGWGTVSGNSNYLYMGGTSMSTPITAGSAVLVREYYTEVENLSSPSASLLKATIINGACNITPGQYGTGDDQEIDGRPDYSQGWGRVDIENSIYPQSPVVMRYYDHVPLNYSESWNVSYDILHTSRPLRVTLVWTDYPGSSLVEAQLVNNLDLIVEAPDGTYYGNGAPDTVNNVEGVELLEPVAGTYTIIVNGTNVPQGPQNFSLVLSYGEVSNIYMYPEHNSYTTNATTEVYMNLTHVDGINSSSIEMQIDGSSVSYLLEAISSGYKVQNLTAQPYSEGFHNVSVSALTDQDEEVNYGWRFYVSVEDNILTIQSPLENSVMEDNILINASSTKWCDFWYNIDGGVNSTIESGFSFNTSVSTTEGQHNITVFAEDLTGYTNSTTVSFYFSTEENVITINGIEDGSVVYDVFDINVSNRKMCNFSYTVESGNSSATYNNTDPLSFSYNTTVHPIAVGQNTLTVFATDITNNTNSTTVNFTLLVNSPTITSPQSGTIYYIPTTTFSLNGTVEHVNNVSVYVNSNLTNESWPVSNNMFNVTNVPLSNGTNTIEVYSMFDDLPVNSTTLYISLGQTVDTSSGDLVTVTVPGIDANVSNPVFNFNISGTSSNPGNISASVVRGTQPGSGSSLTGTVLGIRVYNESDLNYSYQFGRNVSLTLGYDPYLVNNITKLAVGWYNTDEGVWIPYRSTVNTTAHTVTANITHLSIYAPLEDNTAPVISSVTNSSTSSTVTLTWESSEDTDHVEVWTNNSLLGNYSGSGMTESGLSASTLYNYSLRAVDFVGNAGDWYNTSVRTSAATSTISTTSSGGGGGGGGGGGSTGEDVDNIEFKDVLSVYAGKDDLVDFDFTKEQNEIDYVRYTSLKNAGKISVTIEMLKNTSALADKAASGLVYRNVNIWVGKTGYATENNIKDPVIGFMVSKKWVDDNDVNVGTISLNRYSDDVWTKLATEQTGEDEDYYYFEASTPGFSPFAITADIPITLDTENEGTVLQKVETGSEPESVGEEAEAATGDNEEKSTPAISGIVTLLILAVASVLIRKQQN
nr:PGF-pre-PGF domain-containing protein [uncultured Methanolobus sp.]